MQKFLKDNIVYIVIFVVLLGLVLALWNKISKLFESATSGIFGDSKASKDYTESATEVLKDVKTDKAKFSLAIGKHKELADKFYKAMSGWGTDVSEFDVLKNTFTWEDRKEIIKQFGIREGKSFRTWIEGETKLTLNFREGTNYTSWLYGFFNGTGIYG